MALISTASVSAAIWAASLGPAWAGGSWASSMTGRAFESDQASAAARTPRASDDGASRGAASDRIALGGPAASGGEARSEVVDQKAELRAKEVEAARAASQPKEPGWTWLSDAEADAMVAQVLAQDAGQTPRGDLLLMFGRTSAGGGRFDVSRRAYLWFLREAAPDDPHRTFAFWAMIDSAIPAKWGDLEVLHATSGPIFIPQWKWYLQPPREVVDDAWQLLSSRLQTATDAEDRARVWWTIGWIGRFRDCWECSCVAHRESVSAAASSKWGVKAAWDLADNFEWMEQRCEAAASLRRFVSLAPTHERASVAAKRANELCPVR